MDDFVPLLAYGLHGLQENALYGRADGKFRQQRVDWRRVELEHHVGGANLLHPKLQLEQRAAEQDEQLRQIEQRNVRLFGRAAPPGAPLVVANGVTDYGLKTAIY